MVFLFKSLNKPFYFNRKLVKYQVIDGENHGPPTLSKVMNGPTRLCFTDKDLCRVKIQNFSCHCWLPSKRLCVSFHLNFTMKVVKFQ